MIAITTKSSISVKPDTALRVFPFRPYLHIYLLLILLVKAHPLPARRSGCGPFTPVYFSPGMKAFNFSFLNASIASSRAAASFVPHIVRISPLTSMPFCRRAATNA